MVGKTELIDRFQDWKRPMSYEDEVTDCWFPRRSCNWVLLFVPWRKTVCTESYSVILQNPKLSKLGTEGIFSEDPNSNCCRQYILPEAGFELKY
jgi:hypothetical protein